MIFFTFSHLFIPFYNAFFIANSKRIFEFLMWRYFFNTQQNDCLFDTWVMTMGLTIYAVETRRFLSFLVQASLSVELKSKNNTPARKQAIETKQDKQK